MTGGPRVERHSRDEWINGQCGRIAYADVAARCRMPQLAKQGRERENVAIGPRL